MSTDAPTPYTPLYDPATDTAPWATTVDRALTSARRVLDEKATANVHDRDEMIRAAVSLEYALRKLVASLDKEAGR